ncbi:GNAT family N-acetyltransferase [Roseovarius aestuarii]|nr:GNAT family N-acetyltransferase [Roseovarius aestuarii]
MQRKILHPYGAVRRLHAHDLPEIRDHFLRLDAQSRHERFCGSISDAGVVTYAKNIFHHDSIVCGASIDGQLRGLAELRGVTHTRHGITEAAFSVEKMWQNMGIGDALFERVLTIAQNRGVRTLQMICLKENNRMKRLAARHNAELRYGLDEVEAILHPKWPTPLSMAQEFFGEHRRVLPTIFGWPLFGWS